MNQQLALPSNLRECSYQILYLIMLVQQMLFFFEELKSAILVVAILLREPELYNKLTQA